MSFSVRPMQIPGRAHEVPAWLWETGCMVALLLYIAACAWAVLTGFAWAHYAASRFGAGVQYCADGPPLQVDGAPCTTAACLEARSELVWAAHTATIRWELRCASEP